MEEQEMLNLELGTMETERIVLKPARVKIVKAIPLAIERAKSNKAIFEVKHPDKNETIKISSVSYLNEREIITSGTWISLDKEGKIQKGSALAVLLDKLNVKKFSECTGKEIDTELNGKYLCFKAY